MSVGLSTPDGTGSSTRAKGDATTQVRLIETRDLADADRAALRRLLDDAFAGDFSDDDWAHALGGWHAIIESDGRFVAHGSVVQRQIDVGGTPFRAGYVEAVAVAPSHQRRGLGTAVMRALTEIVRNHFELGVLSTGEWGFYERLGWERWRGPSRVRAADGTVRRSPDDDDGVRVLRCGVSQSIDRTEPITCDERRGDAW